VLGRDGDHVADRQRLRGGVGPMAVHPHVAGFARFAKTRSLAARLVEDGYVRVNGHRADAPAKALAVGDVVSPTASAFAGASARWPFTLT
jgi:hypothetical protein